MIILGTNSVKAAGGFDVANSCRFNPADSAYMHKTPNAGNRKKASFSCWIKRSLITSGQTLFWSGSDNSNYIAFIRFLADDRLLVAEINSGSTTWEIITNRLFRDVGSWYHILVAMDTTQGTAANRVKIYVNGVQETSLNIDGGYPALNRDTLINTAVPHQIGHDYVAQYYGGYIAEACFLEGSQNAPTDFGEFDEDSGIWKPIDVSGLTFGTNGFYLDFEASGNLGNDANGGTDLTESGLAATDQSTDTCTNNFATLNPLNPIVHTFEEGNLRIDGSGDNWDSAFSTIGASSGKWYFEMKFLALSGGLIRAAMGLVDARGQTQFATNEVGYTVTNATGDSVGYNGNGTSNTIKKNDTGQYNGTQWSVNDIICMAVDLDNSAVYFRVNGSAWLNSGNPESGASKTGAVTITAGETYVFGGTAYGATTEWQFNFGSPSFAISSGNTDGDGFGNFEFAVPSGYFSLNTKNLAEYG